MGGKGSKNKKKENENVDFDKYVKKKKTPKKDGIGDKPIKISDLQAHIDKNPFVEEYNYIDEKTLNDVYIANYTVAQTEINRLKNRYGNVLPPDEARVVLSGGPNSDYINASYINGFKTVPRSEKAYIATQGPLPETTEDFWRMMIETNSCVILMLTRVVESDVLKCHQYWPNEETPEFETDLYVLKLASIKKEEEVITSKIDIFEKNTQKTRQITHFQYIAWPDHGIPTSTKAFLDLTKLADDANTTQGPLIVHCSAGIGRTGTFIVIHSILEKMRWESKDYKSYDEKLEPMINIVSTLIDLRKQRPGMIQTAEQYEFCYRALNDYLQTNLLQKKN